MRRSILSVDMGRVRTGLALALWDEPQQPGVPPLTEKAMIALPSPTAVRYAPLATVPSSDRQTLIAHIARFVREWEVSVIVIGVLPPRPSPNTTPSANGTLAKRSITLMAEKLARQLHAQLKIKTVCTDESHSSLMAWRGSKVTGLMSVDEGAAIEIVRGYLGTQQTQSFKSV